MPPSSANVSVPGSRGAAAGGPGGASRRSRSSRLTSPPSWKRYVLRANTRARCRGVGVAPGSANVGRPARSASSRVPRPASWARTWSLLSLDWWWAPWLPWSIRAASFGLSSMQAMRFWKPVCGSFRTRTAAFLTQSWVSMASRISSSSTRKPRSLTWLSARPTNWAVPSAFQCARSPVRYRRGPGRPGPVRKRSAVSSGRCR